MKSQTEPDALEDARTAITNTRPFAEDGKIADALADCFTFLLRKVDLRAPQINAASGSPLSSESGNSVSVDEVNPQAQ